MRVLQANKFFFLNGGSETVMFQERDYLMNHGHEVVDFSMHDKRNVDSPYSAYFVENKSYVESKSKLSKAFDAISFIHSSEAVSNISRLINDTQPDLVHCHNIYHQLTPSIISAAKKLGVPTILTLHDYKPVCPTYNRLRNGEACSKCLDGGFSNVVKYRCADGSLGKSSLLYAEATVQKLMGNYEKVDAFIAPSQFMQKSIANRIPQENIHQLYNGVDTNLIQYADEDAGYALFIGRLAPEKGVETLLKAHISTNESWSLTVAGTGPLLDVLKVKYNPSILVGYLSGDALKDAIRKASVIVVPSEWYENCPMSVLEAMAYGKPVVGSRMGGIPELVKHEETGLLYDAGDVVGLQACLDRLMANKSLRKEMGIAGRKRVEQYFTLNKHHQGLMNIYQQVLGA